MVRIGENKMVVNGIHGLPMNLDTVLVKTNIIERMFQKGNNFILFSY